MARQKGTLGLSSNIEPSMNAPLDGREVVNLVSDLTASASFPYFYEGMQVYVKEDHKTYTLIGSDPTISANWTESGGGGGHVIEDNSGSDMPQRESLMFGGDFVVEDDSQNERTKVKPHELDSTDMEEIMSVKPETSVRLPVLLDERSIERQVGWYVNSNGLKKPVYEKSIILSTPATYTFNTQWQTIVSNVTGIENLISVKALRYNDPTPTSGNKAVFISLTSFVYNPTYNEIKAWDATESQSNYVYIDKIIIQYTKTTDTFQ